MPGLDHARIQGLWTSTYAPYMYVPITQYVYDVPERSHVTHTRAIFILFSVRVYTIMCYSDQLEAHIVIHLSYISTCIGTPFR